MNEAKKNATATDVEWTEQQRAVADKALEREREVQKIWWRCSGPQGQCDCTSLDECVNEPVV
jgi:hypothetical protein